MTSKIIMMAIGTILNNDRLKKHIEKEHGKTMKDCVHIISTSCLALPVVGLYIKLFKEITSILKEV